MLLAVSSPDLVFLFSAAGLVLYVASRAAVDALTATNDPHPGRMAFGHWMPIAWSAVLATAAGRTEIGVAIVFATSVAALALNLGVLSMLVPPMEKLPPSARVWPFVLPAALLPLMAGFSASFNWLHAVMMVLLGVAVAGVWRSPPADETPFAVETSRRRVRVVQLIIAILLGAVGAWFGFQAILTADAKTRVATGGLIATAVLAPLLSLPMLGTGAIAGHNGRTSAVVANLVGVVLLNLCLLLPIVILTHYGRLVFFAWRDGIRELTPLLERLHPVAFPLGIWRIDNVLLVVLGMMLLPISLGRWTLSRGEGVALAFGYVAYLIVSAALVVRS